MFNEKREMDPKKVVVDISSDDEDDDHRWLTKLLDDDYADDDVNKNHEVIMVNEDEKNAVKNLKVRLKVKNCLLVDKIKDIDDDDECVVLENDPNEKLEVKDDGVKSKKGGVDEDDEIVVVSEKGQVACRDYPHSRHLCIKFPFSTTPNQSHCKQCYCYVCDCLAPCVYWGNGGSTSDHCHATDKDGRWKLARENARNISKGAQPVKPQLAPAMVQPQNPITRPNMIPGPRASPNVRPPILQNQNRSQILTPRQRLHPNLVSQFVNKHHQNSSNLGIRVQKPVFKKTGQPVGVTITNNRNFHGSYRGPYGDSIRLQNQNSNGSYGGPFGDTNRQQNQNYSVNGMVSRSNTYFRPPQPNAVNTATVNPPKQLNPSFQSQVNTNPFTGNPFRQANMVPPSYIPPQPPSFQSTYVGPVQSSVNPVPFNQVVDSSLSVSVSDYIQNPGQGTQVNTGQVTQVNTQVNTGQGTQVNTGFQDSVTPESAAVPTTSEPTIGDLYLGLTDIQWDFDDGAIEPGLLNIPAFNNDFSSDSFTYLDTGPIFDF